MEVWTSVPDFEGLYEVSNEGKVRSLTSRYFGRVLKRYLKDGYWCVRLWKKGKARHVRVHRILADRFVPNPKGKTKVVFLDGNKLNCELPNLLWATTSEMGRIGKTYAIWNQLIERLGNIRISDPCLMKVLNREFLITRI